MTDHHEDGSEPAWRRQATAESEAGEPVVMSLRMRADGTPALRAGRGREVAFPDLAQAACLAYHLVDAVDKATAIRRDIHACQQYWGQS